MSINWEWGSRFAWQHWFCAVAGGLIAGKPAPTGSAQLTELVFTIDLCGSWLASDGGRSGTR